MQVADTGTPFLLLAATVTVQPSCATGTMMSSRAWRSMRRQRADGLDASDTHPTSTSGQVRMEHSMRGACTKGKAMLTARAQRSRRTMRLSAAALDRILLKKGGGRSHGLGSDSLGCRSHTVSLSFAAAAIFSEDWLFG